MNYRILAVLSTARVRRRWVEAKSDWQLVKQASSRRSLIKRLITGAHSTATTTCSRPTLTADGFAQFFQQKIEAVRAAIALSSPPAAANNTATELFNSWTQVLPDEVVWLIGQALNKICQLDAAPTWIVKEFSGLLAPYIALLFNKSLESGCYPNCFKHAIVLPLLKKVGLDDTQFCNYRPISNLPFLSTHCRFRVCM